jgi:hypothetical protein
VAVAAVWVGVGLLAGCSRHPSDLVGDWRSEPHGNPEARYRLILRRDGTAAYDVFPRERGDEDALVGKWEYRAGELAYYGGGERVRYRVVDVTDDELVLRDHASLELRLHRR